MANPSPWDFATTFSLDEAAELISGGEPGLAESKRRAKPIRDRLHDAYKSAVAWHLNALDPKDESQISSLTFDRVLTSVFMAALAHNAEGGDAAHRFYQWLMDDERSGAGSQKFSREELMRWLSVVGISSTYKFVPDEEKPLGRRERENLLRIVGGLLALLQDTRTVRANTSSEGKIIQALVASYGDKDGISKRSLEDKFKLAKIALQRS